MYVGGEPGMAVSLVANERNGRVVELANSV